MKWYNEKFASSLFGIEKYGDRMREKRNSLSKTNPDRLTAAKLGSSNH